MTPGTNGTGIVYPTIELGGKTYTVKFTRGGLLYRLSKSGTNIADLRNSPRYISTLIECLHAALFDQFGGTPIELAELVYDEDKISLVDQVVAEALKKVFPSPTKAAVEPEAPVQ